MTNGQLHEGCDDVKRSVIYMVSIDSWNYGAWYKELRGHSFDCLLDIVDKQLGGQEIMFRVIGAYHPVKYIKPQHCIIQGQRFAEHEELIKFYGQ